VHGSHGQGAVAWHYAIVESKGNELLEHTLEKKHNPYQQYIYMNHAPLFFMQNFILLKERTICNEKSLN
jgi:DNA-binding FadR family transcriptional regulator